MIISVYLQLNVFKNALSQCKSHGTLKLNMPVKSLNKCFPIFRENGYVEVAATIAIFAIFKSCIHVLWSSMS